MRKSQSILEYTILIIIIVGAFITMQVYIKRGFQGRWKQAADDLGDQYDVSAFESNTSYTINSSSASKVTVVNDVSYDGTLGKMTYREDTTSTKEKKDVSSYLGAAGL